MDDRQFLAYMNGPARRHKGHKFWVVTEKQRLSSLRDVLPTPKSRQSVREEDGNLSNKFALGSFVWQ